MADDNMTKAEKAEAAAVRRRWITLGELLAVAAVIISGLTFWNSYSERRSNEVERASEERSADMRARTLILRGVPDKEGEVLAISAPTDQAIQSQTVAFPTALDLESIETTNPASRPTGSTARSARRAAPPDSATRTPATSGCPSRSRRAMSPTAR